jgi:DNA replication protein DnaC
MSREPQRNRQAISLAGAIAQVADRGDLAGGIAQLGDELWWARRDAEVASQRAAMEASDQRQRFRRRREDLAEAGFPLRALEYALAADEDNPVLARIRAWDPKQENVLLLSGSKGVGKTVAATWWALRHEQAPAFARAAMFVASSRYDRDDPAGRSRWLRASALVLDDLGAEFVDAKGSALVDLDELIDVFYGDRKPLLITTNCTSKEFIARYGERIVDRIRECGAFFEWSGPSLRGRAEP